MQTVPDVASLDTDDTGGSPLLAYLAECRTLVLDEIRDLVPADARCRAVLYDLMLDYPLRNAKALRPALCIATCRALGGRLEAVLRSAAVLELYHNAFLIHDDVEDGSERRRDQPTLHRTHGVPIAVNVGDAMLALTLPPLLDNMQLLGMGKALRILQVVARMARESAEGQAIELDWVRHGRWDVADADYLRMVYKKTSWYTFVTPTLVGGVVAGASPTRLAALRRFASLLGIAFQIQDDVLNLAGEGTPYGKEIAGDLWEGKHTLILMHVMRAAAPADRARAQAILQKPRPLADGEAGAVGTLLEELVGSGAVTPAARDRLAAAVALLHPDGGAKTEADVAFLRALIERHGSIGHARASAQRLARRAERALAGLGEWLAPSVHRRFLEALTQFVVRRDH